MPIELTEADDPMLFAVCIPAGRLVFQFNEVTATLQAMSPPQGQTGVPEMARAMREASRTPEIAAQATDAQLFAAYARAAKAVEQSGNG
jgi:hypothetical protein